MPLNSYRDGTRRAFSPSLRSGHISGALSLSSIRFCFRVGVSPDEKVRLWGFDVVDYILDWHHTLDGVFLRLEDRIGKEMLTSTCKLHWNLGSRLAWRRAVGTCIVMY